MRFATLTFILLASAGCASRNAHLAAPPPELGPPSATWRMVETRGLDVYTDTDTDPEAQTAELERIYDAFADRLFPLKRQASLPRFRVVMFESAKDYAVAAPPGSDGYTESAAPGDIESNTTIVLGASHQSMMRVIEHELTHAFAERALGPIPTWLNEGLARFYETARIEGGTIILGEARYLGNGLGMVPRPSELIRVDRARFYMAGKPRTFDVMQQVTANYAGAWALVHLLYTGKPDYRRRFDAYIDGLARAEPPLAAWEKAFGDIDYNELDSDAIAQLTSRVLGTRVASYAPSPKTTVTTMRAMSEAEVHVLRATLLGADHLAAMEREVQSARALAPSWPEAMALWGMVKEDRRDIEAARAELTAAVSGSHDEPRYLLALASFEIDRAIKFRPSEGRGLPPDLEGLVNRLAANAHTGDELSLVARYWAIRHDAARGLPYAKRAVEAQPNCHRCFGIMGILYSEQHDYDSAVDAFNRGLCLVPDGEHDSLLTKMLGQAMAARSAASARRAEDAHGKSEPTTPVSTDPKRP